MSDAPPTKVFVSSGLLRKGVTEHRVSNFGEIAGHSWCALSIYGPPHMLGRDCHTTREAAVEAWEARRRAKIDALQAQLEKLRALTP
jgi:hypothetical protein